MITYRSLKARLTAIIKEAFPGHKVYFDNVEKSDTPYFYVEMTPLRTRTVDGDGVYHDRAIDLDIQLILAADKYGRVDRIQLYDAAQTLDMVIRPVLRVEDRAITIQESDVTIHDDILHYMFTLVFTDADMDQVEHELMEGLELNINKEG